MLVDGGCVQWLAVDFFRYGLVGVSVWPELWRRFKSCMVV